MTGPLLIYFIAAWSEILFILKRINKFGIKIAAKLLDLVSKNAKLNLWAFSTVSIKKKPYIYV